MFLKRILFASSLISLLMGSQAIYADGLYMGPSVLVQHISASHSNFTGLSPRLGFGYQGLSDDFYLAGEIFAVPTTITFSDNHGSHSSARVTHSFGASLLPGIVLDNQMIGFARLGIVNTEFSGPNVNKNGGQLGVGVQGAITPNWSYRAEYIYTSYRSIAGLGSAKSNEIGLGAIYQFLG